MRFLILLPLFICYSDAIARPMLHKHIFSIEAAITTFPPPVQSPQEPEELKLTVLGKQETRISGVVARRSNIDLASLNIDGTDVLPGGEFSFNKTVGPRTVEKGFLEAPEIFMGELTKGVGGGTCQVSSTLFGAAVRAGMVILERRAHSRLPDYLPPGWDAMVALNDPSICAKDHNACSDLRFRNPFKFPVVVNVWPMNGILHAEILGEGDAPKLKTVWIRNSITSFKTVIEFDPKLSHGEEKIFEKGKDGMTGFLSVEVEGGGGPILRHISMYRPVEQVLHVGPGWIPSREIPSREMPTALVNADVDAGTGIAHSF